MAEIVRDRTWCTLVDDSAVSWDVMDLVARRMSEGMVERYPCGERAIARIFRRYAPIPGTQARRLVEERLYSFAPEDDQWFNAERWARQVDAATAAAES
jgi:hypothetical protein